MSGNRFKKLFVALLIFVQLGFFLPAPVFAQLVSCGLTLVTPCFMSDPNNGNLPAPLAVPANTTFDTALAGIVAQNATCATAEQIYFSTDGALKLGMSGLAVIGGSSVQLAQLKLNIAKIEDVFIPCRIDALALLTPLPAPTAIAANKKQTLHDQIGKAIDSLNARDEALQAQEANAEQGFWKTLMITVLTKTSKAVADALVNKLVSNYKITNFKQYVDSVATLMYDNQFLRDNFPSAQGQLMARAILENPELRYKVQPGIFTAADQALAFNPKAFDTNDPNFYTNMANAGNSIANPYFQNTVYVGGVDQARANSLAYAQGHIAQGNGYKTPVNCVGSLSQQKSIDLQSKAASDELDNRQALLTSLQQAQSLGKTVSDSDLKKAQADYDAALKKWNNVPFAAAGSNSVGGANGGNSTEGTMAINICEAIVAPANLVNKGIDQAFNAIGINMAQYNNNNLPSYISLIGDVASQIGTSFIFGGLGGAKNAALINEGRVVNGAVAAGTQLLYNNASENLAKGVDLRFDLNSGVPNSYTLSWSIISDKLSTASFVTVSGDGVSSTKIDPNTKGVVPNKFGINASLAITTTRGGDYVLTVFDANGRALTAATTTLTLTNTQQAINYDPNSPQVAGAFTATPAIQTRGPETQVFIR